MDKRDNGSRLYILLTGIIVLMTKLFISYAKKDTRKLAVDLAAALNTIDGVSVWVDKSLRAGRSWELQIEKHIDECDTMIVLYSPDINRHKQGDPDSYVLTEIHYAKRIVKKHIIPVMAIETAPPMALALEQYIDFTLDGLTLDDLVVALCSELHIDPTRKQANTAETPAPTRQPEEPTPASAAAVKAIIGEPFAWCAVPAGEFIYQKDQRLTLPAFQIAKYPVTYSQFQTFIDAKDGFKDPRWWQGLAQYQSDKPGDQKWKIADHPRENVSWYDAVAFCRWLSHRLGGRYDIDRPDDWEVRLPTEFEWEKAARGTDGREYPWGNGFDKNRANTREAGIEQTMPVTRYTDGTPPHSGASPYGVLDMSGNVWEWCLTDYHDPQMVASNENISSNSRRVLRGGSWSSRNDFARAAYRDDGNPSSRNVSSGFRLCRVRAPSR